MTLTGVLTGDGSGESDTIAVTVGTPAMSIGFEVTGVNPAAENLRVRVPGVPSTARPAKVARPWASVVTVVWPVSVPPPVG